MAQLSASPGVVFTLPHFSYTLSDEEYRLLSKFIQENYGIYLRRKSGRCFPPACKACWRI